MKEKVEKFNLQLLDIVLIADRTFSNHELSNIEGNELEMISNEYFEDIFNSLTKICRNVVHYQSPKELIDNAHKHKEDLVVTIFGGKDSRNRMALVPAICESYGIKFVGADVYARIVCQDKFLSKEFARRFNIKSPDSILIDSNSPYVAIENLNLPLVVKPNFEGSSIGIKDNSKVNSFSDALEMISLLKKGFDSILVEEFISGKEVCICIVGNKNNIRMFDVMEVYFEEDETFLYNRIYSAREKHLTNKSMNHRNITEELNPNQQKSILDLFHALGKADYMRIDGRINTEGFSLIELTPDGYLGSDSSFADACKNRNISYENLLIMIINTALDGYHIPYSNYKGN